MERAKINKKSISILTIMILIIPIYMTLIPTAESNSAPATEFSYTFNSNGFDDMVKSIDGGYVMLSHKYISLSNYAGLISNTFLIKTNSSGQMLWNRTLSPAGYSDIPYAITRTVDGGFAVTGTTMTGTLTIWDYSNYSQTGHGVPITYLTSPGIFLMKLNGTGFKEWGRTFSYTNATVTAKTLVQTNDGGYALSGEYRNSTSGKSYVFIVKTYSSGSQQFAYYYGASSEGNSYANSIIEASNGNLVVTGAKNSSLGDYDLYFLKTNSIGNIILNNTYGVSSLNETGSKVIETADSGYAIIGCTYSNQVNSNVLFTKLDVNGTLNWNKTYGGSYNSYGYSIIEDVDGGYAIAGSTNSSGTLDSLLIKTDVAGNAIWNITQGGSMSDGTYAIVQSNDRGYVMAGGSNGQGWLVKVAAGQDTLPTGPETWAVIVGVSIYPYLPADSQLFCSDDDAIGLYNQLAPIYGADHIKLLLDRTATKSAIMSSVADWLSIREDSDDTVLFYFSGHGGYGTDLAPIDETDHYDEYICPANSLTTSWINDIRDDEFTLWLQSFDTEKMVTILDTCFSGGFVNRSATFSKSIDEKMLNVEPFINSPPTDIFAKDLSKNGRIIITASAENETSAEYFSLGHGIFTYYLLDALNNLQQVDVNLNSEVSAEEIFDYTKAKVELFYLGTNSSQHPTMYDGYPGELTLLTYTPVYAFSVSSNHGSASPTVGAHSYNSGTVVSCSVVSPVTEGSTVWTCTGWTGTGSVSSGSGTTTSFTITQNSSITWNWVPTYSFTVSSDHGGPSPTTGAHSYPSGTVVSCSVVSPVTEGSTVWTCIGWTGTGSVSSGSGTTTSFTIAQDSSITWNWQGTPVPTISPTQSPTNNPTNNPTNRPSNNNPTQQPTTTNPTTSTTQTPSPSPSIPEIPSIAVLLLLLIPITLGVIAHRKQRKPSFH